MMIHLVRVAVITDLLVEYAFGIDNVEASVNNLGTEECHKKEIGYPRESTIATFVSNFPCGIPPYKSVDKGVYKCEDVKVRSECGEPDCRWKPKAYAAAADAETAGKCLMT